MASPREPPHIVLWGADHPALGTVVSADLDGFAAIALSAGLHPKPYPHLDANEDAVLAAAGEHGRLLAVADGHNGFDAAAGAIRGLRARLERLDDPQLDPEATLSAFTEDATQGVREAVSRADRARRHSRTALTVLLAVRKSVHVCQWGDTVALRIRAGKGQVVVPPSSFLSGQGERPRRAAVGLRSEDVLIAASDGLTGYLGERWHRRVSDLVQPLQNPEAAARELIEAAFRGGAGDHIGVAVMRSALEEG